MILCIDFHNSLMLGRILTIKLPLYSEENAQHVHHNHAETTPSYIRLRMGKRICLLVRKKYLLHGVFGCGKKVGFSKRLQRADSCRRRQDFSDKIASALGSSGSITSVA